MKILIFLLVSAFTTTGFADVLNPISQKDAQVNVTLVESVESFRTNDGMISGSVATIFRGSALGFSSVFVTFADSLEDPSFTFEFKLIIGRPKNINLLKNNDGSYVFSINVTRVESTEIGYKYYTEKIVLKVKNNSGTYSVEKL